MHLPLFIAEKSSFFPSSILLCNIYFVNKNIPITLPNFHYNMGLDKSIGKISFILEFLDLFLGTGYFNICTKKRNSRIFLESMFGEKISFEEWFEIFLEKARLLWHYLLPENLKDKIFKTMKENYNSHNKRDKSRKKVSITNGDEISDLEEI